MEFSRNIMMGDPKYFAIKKGANPHTRNRWGLRKTVDPAKARAQWEKMAETLADHGVNVHVIPPDPSYPGLVFPANAGVALQVEEKIPLHQREFILSRLTVSRGGETHIYRRFLNELEVRTHESLYSFEGEADLNPWGDRFIFTYGPLKKQRWAACWGIPPWKRVYGFRTSERAGEEISHRFSPEKIMKMKLCREAFYHGDTVLCSFGPKREYLMVYLPGIHKRDRPQLAGHPGVIPLSKSDAWAFAANSFQIIQEGGCVLFMPAGVSKELRQQIEAKGVQTVTVEVSEFL
ncbi:MAG: hypothetical protein R3257_07165, partial [bacterium]|nr:hypothetical protein [bacterium]